MPEVVYRCIAENAAARIELHGEDQRAWFKTAETIASAVLGREARAVYANHTEGPMILGYNVDREPVEAEGFSWTKPIVPDGWMLREASNGGVDRIVPKRNTKAGKELYAALHVGESFTSIIDLFGGMPHRVMVPNEPHRMFSPGWTTIGGVLWVVWGADPERDTGGFNKAGSERPDPTIWERAKLSEYYAAIENQVVPADA